MLEYKLMQDETERLQRAKAEIEEKAKRDKEESMRLLNKQDEEKKTNDRFKAEIKKVERQIVEANECVKFMRKNIKFSYKLVSVLPEHFKLDAIHMDSGIPTRQEIMIQVQNIDKGEIYEWSQKKFQEKLEEIKDKMDTFQETGGQAMDSEDPFNEALEPLQLGKAYYRLEGLAYLMDNPTTVSIIG